MSEPQSQKKMRMAGPALRIAARLMETPGPSSALFAVATKQMGLHQLQGIRIPPHVTPYQPLHLRTATRKEGPGE